MNRYSEFIRFGTVGGLGFIVDTAALYFFLFFGFGYYVGRLFSYLLAATFTWYLHRNFTFKNATKEKQHYQWIRFIVVNAIGGSANYIIYIILVMQYEHFKNYPVLAVAVGSMVGLFVNYSLSKKMVFR